MKYLDLSFDNEELFLTYPYVDKSSLDVFNENLNTTFSDSNADSGLLPTGLLYSNKDSSILVFERPPCYKPVTLAPFKKDQAANKSKDLFYQYNLPLPWQVYIAEYYNNGALAAITMLFSDSEINSIVPISGQNSIDIFNQRLTPLRIPTLPNIYENLEFCIDRGIENIIGDNIEAKILGAYNAIWDTVFNYDLIDIFNYGLSHAREDYGLEFSHHTGDMGLSFLAAWDEFTLSEILDSLSMFRQSSSTVTLAQIDSSDFYEASFVKFANLIPGLV